MSYIIDRFEGDNAVCEKEDRTTLIFPRRELQPQSMEDTQTVIDNLRLGKPVIVNLENLQSEAAQRLLDFISGAIYALEGNIRKVSRGIFLLAPDGVDISGNIASSFASNIRKSDTPSRRYE